VNSSVLYETKERWESGRVEKARKARPGAQGEGSKIPGRGAGVCLMGGNKNGKLQKVERVQKPWGQGTVCGVSGKQGRGEKIRRQEVSQNIGRPGKMRFKKKKDHFDAGFFDTDGMSKPSPLTSKSKV